MICRLFASLSDIVEHLSYILFPLISIASAITGGSRSVRVAGTVGADRVGCGGVAASGMPPYLTLSCSTGACGPAVALAGARTVCLAPSLLNQAMALLASVAAIASTTEAKY